MKKPKQCHICKTTKMVIHIYNGYRLHSYNLNNGRIGKEAYWTKEVDERTDRIGQEIECVNCGLVYELAGWAKESRWVQLEVAIK